LPLASCLLNGVSLDRLRGTIIRPLFFRPPFYYMILHRFYITVNMVLQCRVILSLKKVKGDYIVKKKILMSSIFVLILALLFGCGKNKGEFNTDRMITVVSREDGSGTRGAFIELTGLEEKDSDGNKKDTTTKEAIITNKTDVMIQTVAGDDYAIGYISLGSLNDSVKAVKLNGVEATADNVKNGSYTLARPFNVAVKGEGTSLAKDFIDFILSSKGQEVVSAAGYIGVKDEAVSYSGNKPEGKIVIGGSSSVGPVMEKLVEAYKEVNSNAEIELQVTDSTSGMTGAMEGTLDIGMASRELKDSEKAELTSVVIAKDGIAVVVNNNNPLEDLTMDEVKEIFNGSITSWSEVK
jgi:phosphate transport system substrate-binding protein